VYIWQTEFGTLKVLNKKQTMGRHTTVIGHIRTKYIIHGHVVSNEIRLKTKALSGMHNGCIENQFHRFRCATYGL